MNPKEERPKVDENPFEHLKLGDWEILDQVTKRSLCPICNKSRKYFCYTCYVPVVELEGKIPKLKLPIKIDIIKHRGEIDGKSTAAHAAVLASDDVKIFTYPMIPEYGPDERVVLVYPGKLARSISSLFGMQDDAVDIITEALCDVTLRDTPPGDVTSGDVTSSDVTSGDVMSDDVTSGNVTSSDATSRPFHVTRAVFIDSTWNQSKGIYKDPRLRALPCVVLKARLSQFWRHQKGSPRWYLATVEAVHQLLVELHESAWQRHKGADVRPHLGPYCGQYDDLLFFFRYMYSKIHTLYGHENLLSYQRRLV